VTAPGTAVAFRALTPSDLPTVHDWLGRAHISRWWGERGTYEATLAEYLPSIDGRDPTDVFLILVDARPVGMIQTYLVSDYPDYAAIVDVGEEVAGVDVFIADQQLLGRGLGTEVISAFVSDVVFAREATRACVADPDVANLASLRAFEKAGFTRGREFHDPDDGREHVLMRRERGRNGEG